MFACIASNSMELGVIQQMVGFIKTINTELE